MATEMTARPPLPPFTRESAIQKVRLAEDGWNTRDPQKVLGTFASELSEAAKRRLENLGIAPKSPSASFGKRGSEQKGGATLRKSFPAR
ncbi:MAG: DUF1348 family protein [Candidatus Sulfotelmatobacter sp.]